MPKKKIVIEDTSTYTDKADLPELVSKRTLKLGVDGLFTDKEEIKLAKELEKKYLSEYTIESVSDKNLLYYLIYLEVLHTAKLQKAANEFTASNENLPTWLLDSIHKNINQIIEIKDKLGLTKKEEVANDAYKSLEMLRKKFKLWCENNQASRTLVCPHCSQMVMLKIRTTQWEAQKHPFFKDRLLGNEHLIRLYKQGKLTKEDVANVLGTSSQYTDWLITKWSVDTDTPSKVDDHFDKEVTGVKQESPVIPLTADPIPTFVQEEIPTEVVKDVSPLNDNPEIGTVTQ
jgi:DNA-directed RNA polymerase subunit RPC12/RpoP